MSRFLLAACLAFSLNAQVKINEVLFYSDPSSQDAFRTHQWLELYNAGSDPVDLTSWTVSAEVPGRASRGWSLDWERADSTMSASGLWPV